MNFTCFFLNNRKNWKGMNVKTDRYLKCELKIRKKCARIRIVWSRLYEEVCIP